MAKGLRWSEHTSDQKSSLVNQESLFLRLGPMVQSFSYIVQNKICVGGTCIFTGKIGNWSDHRTKRRIGNVDR